MKKLHRNIIITTIGISLIIASGLSYNKIKNYIKVKSLEKAIESEYKERLKLRKLKKSSFCGNATMDINKLNTINLDKENIIPITLPLDNKNEN